MNPIQKFYNQSKSDVDKQNGGITLIRSRIVSDWISGSNNILDVGCNDGSEDIPFIEKGKSVWGLDISKEAVSIAKKRGVTAKVCDISKSEIPFDKKFDCVIAGEIIEHIVDTDDFLIKINRILKKNGKLIITTPNIASLGRRLMLLIGKNPFIETSLKQKIYGTAPVGHLRYFTKDSLTELVENNGYKIKELTSDYINLGPFSSSWLGKLYPGLGWRLILLAEKK